jgi:hypothetical protein
MSGRQARLCGGADAILDAAALWRHYGACNGLLIGAPACARAGPEQSHSVCRRIAAPKGRNKTVKRDLEFGVESHEQLAAKLIVRVIGIGPTPRNDRVVDDRRILIEYVVCSGA